MGNSLVGFFPFFPFLFPLELLNNFKWILRGGCLSFISAACLIRIAHVSLSSSWKSLWIMEKIRGFMA